MKCKWTHTDIKALQKDTFMVGFASLPEATRKKVVEALLATPHQNDLSSIFEEERVAFYRKK